MAVTETAAPVCEGCKHWRLFRQGTNKRAGHCRRYAPAASTSGGPMAPAQWPVTLEDDSCADYAAAAPSEAKAEEGRVDVGAVDVATTEHAPGAAKRTARRTQKGGGSRKTR